MYQHDENVFSLSDAFDDVDETFGNEYDEDESAYDDDFFDTEEEHDPNDDTYDDMSGYTIVDDNSIYKLLEKSEEEEPETIASPIPENEQTVILSDPHVALLHDGDELSLCFDGDECRVLHGGKTVGSFKAAYVRKLRGERGGQKARVYYKKTTPPMARLVFGDGAEIPAASQENM